MLCYVTFFPLSIPRDNIKARNKFKLERKKHLRKLEVPHYKKDLTVELIDSDYTLTKLNEINT